ncbi:MAG: NAD-dependent epimerase/dehydratase family protein [Bacteroidales bacterium]
MRVTLIGGSGFIGTRLTELLHNDENFEIKIIDLLESFFFNQYTQIGDVREQDQMDQMLRNTDVVVLLAAIHRDDESVSSHYFDTNVTGMVRTLKAMELNGVRRIVFFSSVAVYGLNKNNPDEDHPFDPFNHYGESKRQAEVILQEWYKTHPEWNINIIRPTVVFGERNRGNVYNLLKQIAGGHFAMIGSGKNRKSMAYVGNIVAFAKFLIEEKTTGYNVYNYADKDDFTMNQLVSHVETVLNRRIPATRIPYPIGMLGGYCFDFLAFITKRKLPISSVRVRKFCATTEFDASKLQNSGFKYPYSLSEGLARTLEFEFVDPPKDNIVFKSE